MCLAPMCLLCCLKEGSWWHSGRLGLVRQFISLMYLLCVSLMSGIHRNSMCLLQLFPHYSTERIAIAVRNGWLERQPSMTSQSKQQSLLPHCNQNDNKLMLHLATPRNKTSVCSPSH